MHDGMTPVQWLLIRHFSPNENFGNPLAMHFELISALDALRAYVGRKIVIHCGHDETRPRGWHPTGRAVDLHIEGLHPMEQYIAATRFADFTGIGVYLWWEHPGLHLDNRPLDVGQARAVWGSLAEKEYVAVDYDFLLAAAALPWPPATGA